MKVLLSICLLLCLAFTANSARVRTHTKSQSATSQWKPYIDQLSYAGMSGVIMISATDGSVWTSKSLSLKAGEGAAIASLFKNPRAALISGVTVNGVKYDVSTANPSLIVGRSSIGGVVLAPTEKAIIISTYSSTAQPFNANNAVQKVASVIRSIGF